MGVPEAKTPSTLFNSDLFLWQGISLWRTAHVRNTIITFNTWILYNLSICALHYPILKNRKKISNIRAKNDHDIFCMVCNYFEYLNTINAYDFKFAFSLYLIVKCEALLVLGISARRPYERAYVLTSVHFTPDF